MQSGESPGTSSGEGASHEGALPESADLNSASQATSSTKHSNTNTLEDRLAAQRADEEEAAVDVILGFVACARPGAPTSVLLSKGSRGDSGGSSGPHGGDNGGDDGDEAESLGMLRGAKRHAHPAAMAAATALAQVTLNGKGGAGVDANGSLQPSPVNGRRSNNGEGLTGNAIHDAAMRILDAANHSRYTIENAPILFRHLGLSVTTDELLVQFPEQGQWLDLPTGPLIDAFHFHRRAQHLEIGRVLEALRLSTLLLPPWRYFLYKTRIDSLEDAVTRRDADAGGAADGGGGGGSVREHSASASHGNAATRSGGALLTAQYNTAPSAQQGVRDDAQRIRLLVRHVAVVRLDANIRPKHRLFLSVALVLAFVGIAMVGTVAGLWLNSSYSLKVDQLTGMQKIFNVFTLQFQSSEFELLGKHMVRHVQAIVGMISMNEGRNSNQILQTMGGDVSWAADGINRTDAYATLLEPIGSSLEAARSLLNDPSNAAAATLLTTDVLMATFLGRVLTATGGPSGSAIGAAGTPTGALRNGLLGNLRVVLANVSNYNQSVYTAAAARGGFNASAASRFVGVLGGVTASSATTATVLVDAPPRDAAPSTGAQMWPASPSRTDLLAMAASYSAGGRSTSSTGSITTTTVSGSTYALTAPLVLDDAFFVPPNPTTGGPVSRCRSLLDLSNATRLAVDCSIPSLFAPTAFFNEAAVAAGLSDRAGHGVLSASGTYNDTALGGLSRNYSTYIAGFNVTVRRIAPSSPFHSSKTPVDTALNPNNVSAADLSTLLLAACLGNGSHVHFGMNDAFGIPFFTAEVHPKTGRLMRLVDQNTTAPLQEVRVTAPSVLLDSASSVWWSLYIPTRQQVLTAFLTKEQVAELQLQKYLLPMIAAMNTRSRNRQFNKGDPSVLRRVDYTVARLFKEPSHKVEFLPRLGRLQHDCYDSAVTLPASQCIELDTLARDALAPTRSSRVLTRTLNRSYTGGRLYAAAAATIGGAAIVATVADDYLFAADYDGLVSIMNAFNAKLPNTSTLEAMVVVRDSVSGVVNAQLGEKYLFANECKGYCKREAPSRIAAENVMANKTFGWLIQQDYRPEPVFAAYGFVDYLGAGIVIEQDVVAVRGSILSILVSIMDAHNGRGDTTVEAALVHYKGMPVNRVYDRFASCSHVESCIYHSRDPKTFGVVFRSDCADCTQIPVPRPSEVTYLTTTRCTLGVGDCSMAHDTTAIRPLLEQNAQPKDTRAVDYRNKAVIVVYNYHVQLSVGVVLKIDVDEVNAPIVIQVAVAAATATTIIVIGMITLILFSHSVLNRIEQEWIRSKALIDTERTRFNHMVQTIVPKRMQRDLKLINSGAGGGNSPGSSISSGSGGAGGASESGASSAESLISNYAGCRSSATIHDLAMCFVDIVDFSLLTRDWHVDFVAKYLSYYQHVVLRLMEEFTIDRVRFLGDAVFCVAGLCIDARERRRQRGGGAGAAGPRKGRGAPRAKDGDGESPRRLAVGPSGSSPATGADKPKGRPTRGGAFVSSSDDDEPQNGSRGDSQESDQDDGREKGRGQRHGSGAGQDKALPSMTERSHPPVLRLASFASALVDLLGPRYAHFPERVPAIERLYTAVTEELGPIFPQVAAMMHPSDVARYAGMTLARKSSTADGGGKEDRRGSNVHDTNSKNNKDRDSNTENSGSDSGGDSDSDGASPSGGGGARMGGPYTAGRDGGVNPEDIGSVLMPPVRVGIHVGTATFVVLQMGNTPSFDVFSPAVSLARRMEATSMPNRIHLSEPAKAALEISDTDGFFTFEAPRKTAVKGVGTVTSFLVESAAAPLPPALLKELHVSFAVRRVHHDDLGGGGGGGGGHTPGQ